MTDEYDYPADGLQQLAARLLRTTPHRVTRNGSVGSADPEPESDLDLLRRVTAERVAAANEPEPDVGRLYVPREGHNPVADRGDRDMREFVDQLFSGGQL